MRYRVLGSVALLGPDDDTPGALGLGAVGGNTVEVPGDKLRALLSVLLLKANSWVDTDVVVDAVWGERAPATVRRSLRTNIWQLRKLLDGPGAEESVIEGRTGAYRLNAARSELDTWVFEDLITEGRAALARGEGHSAADMLLSALSLWRGEPYGLLPGGLAGAEAARLSELRWTARKTLADALLAIGETGDAVAVLRAVLAEDPLREPFWCRLVSALHAADRRADALEAYQQARTVLVDELGMDPSAELRAAHQRVLDDEPKREPAPQVPVALRPVKPEPSPELKPEREPARRNFLPARPTGFVGRTQEIAAVLRVAKAHAAAKTQAPLLVLIDGMPGAGKTSFALEVAHRLAEGYPDGQLFLDLRGHRYGVVAAADALHTLLDTLGAGPDGIADGVAARAAQWRARLAQKRAVVLVDDVADAEQLERLLPASSPSVVLVTSRRRIPPPFGALRVRLDPLTQTEAVEVLTTGLRLRADEQELAEEVALTYGRLPAAMRVLNDRLRHRTGWSMQRVANHMRKASGLLRTLRSDDYNAVDAFDASYRRLPAPTQRLLRLLGSSPIFDVDAYAASALADVSIADAEPMLEELAEHNLLSPRTGGRYRLHSLQRVFAAELAASEDSPRRQHLARARLLAYYLRCTMHAVAVAKDDPKAAALDADVPFGTIDSPVTARDWLQLERANLLAVAEATSGTQSRRLRDLIVGFDPAFASTTDDLTPRRQRAFSAVRMARTGTFTAAAAAVAFAAGSPAGLLADGDAGGSVVASWLDAVGSDTSTGGGSTPKQEGEWQGAPPAAPAPETPDAPDDDGGYVGKHRLPDDQPEDVDKQAEKAPGVGKAPTDTSDTDASDHDRGKHAEDRQGGENDENGQGGENREGGEDDGGLVGGVTDTATTVVSGEDEPEGPEQQPEEQQSNQDGGEQRQSSERSARSSEREQEQPAEEQAAEEPGKSEPAQEQPAEEAPAEEPPAEQPTEEQPAEQPKNATGGAGFYFVVGAPPGGNYYDKAADQLADSAQQMQKNLQNSAQKAQKQLAGALSYYAG